MDPRSARLRNTVLIVAFGTSLAAVGGACVFKQAPVSAEQEACTAIGTFLQSCTPSPSCSATALSECPQITATLSDAFLNGMITCAQTGGQCDAGSALASPCATFDLGAASSMQLQIASDYCAACESTPRASCIDSFYGVGGVGVVDAPVFAASDGIIGTIDRTCIAHLDIDAGATACADAFVACARPILTAQLFVPGACTGDASFVAPLALDGERP